MAATKSEPINPYRTLLFSLTLACAIAGIGLAVTAGTMRDDPAGAASVWVWAGHVLTLGIATFVGELVIAGTMWRATVAAEPTGNSAPASADA